MKEIFKTNEMDDIIKYLPINDNKLIPPEKLSTEVVVYWNRIHQYALKNNIDEVLEIIIPELKPFCEYIKCVLMAFKEDKINIHEWKQLQNEFIITTLFGIARDFDFSDEVGRNSLHDLVIDCIVKLPLKMPLLTILIDILAKMNTSAHNLIEEVNELLSTINDSKQKPSVEELNKTNEEIVKVKEKIESISEELDSMIKQNDMAEAFKLEENMNILKGLLTKLKNEQYVCSPERELFLDEKCLDIQICLLRHRSITISTPTLEQMETRYIQEELGESKKSTLYHKLFECCILYSLNNRKTAKFYAELITLPIRFYQVLEDNDAILVLSIKGFTDLLNIHGPNIFPNVPTNLSGFCSNEKEHQFVKFLIDKLVDMLDDKRKDISETATKAISKLIYFGITVTCQTFCRVLVKWYNPEIINKNPLGCQLFGLAFIRFCQHFKESENIIVNSVVPILSSLSRVSLNDINIDNLIKFLAALSQLRNTEELHLHNVLNFILCNKILENVNARAVELYVKMLMTLEIPSAQDILDNLKLKVEEIMLELSEGPLKRKIKKYLLKLSNAKVVRETDVNHNNKIRQASQNSDTGETDTPDNYTIHDTDDSVGTPTSLKRSVDLRFSELDDLAVDTVEKTSELFKKKLRLETEKSNEVVENESQNEFNKRTNTTEVQTVSPKITKFE